MNERIDQFCEILRVKLTSIDNNMQALKAKIDSKARTAEQDVQSHLDSVKKRSHKIIRNSQPRRPTS